MTPLELIKQEVLKAEFLNSKNKPVILITPEKIIIHGNPLEAEKLISEIIKNKKY